MNEEVIRQIAGRDPNELLNATKLCGTRFWSQVCLCVLVCEDLFYEIYDTCEERKMVRFRNKRLLNNCQRSFEKFDKWVKKNKEVYLIRDYGIQVHKRLEKQLRDLFLTFKIYLERHGQKDAVSKANILVAVTLMFYSVDLFDLFFKLYENEWGIDMSGDYLPARIKEAADSFNCFSNDFINPVKNNLNPTENYASVCAFNALIDRLLDEDMLDEAGMEVLKLNDKQEFLEQVERSNTIDILKEKYKVVNGKK